MKRQTLLLSAMSVFEIYYGMKQSRARGKKRRRGRVCELLKDPSRAPLGPTGSVGSNAHDTHF